MASSFPPTDSQGGRLIIVATPIGNLEDISARAAKSLETADLIAAEDTRHSLRLLQHLGLRKSLISYHQHNEARRTEELLRQLSSGKVVAVISDAGMPGISDPGLRIVQACRNHAIPVEVIPGASAVMTALAGSGFSATPFYFGGFLPVKSGQRAKELQAAGERTCTSIYFESPHRLLKSLRAAADELLLQDRRLCVARELTKTFEEFQIGTPSHLEQHFSQSKVRGEICLLIEAPPRRAKEKQQGATDSS